MDLPFGLSFYNRNIGDFPIVPVINMFAEETPTEGKVSLISRPGLSYSTAAFDARKVEAIYQDSGVLDGEFYTIAGNNVYREDVQIGSLGGVEVGSIAAYRTKVFFCRGEDIFSFDGSTYEGITFPDDADVLKIVIGGSRLIAIRKDTQRFYWSGVLTSTFDGLAFASAENSPDNLLDMLFIGDKLFLFGKSSVEIWPVTTDPDLPFAPLQGATFQVGIKNTGACCSVASSFAWISDDNSIFYGSPDKVISYPGLDAKIAKEDSARLWSFFFEGEQFIVCELSAESWVFKLSSQTWSLFSTYGQSQWLANSYASGRFGSRLEGRHLEWAEDFVEIGGPLVREFSSWTPVTSDGLTIDNVIVRCNAGHTTFFEGFYQNPQIGLRTSRDGGNKWTDWRERNLGENGQYRTQVYWNGLGYYAFPGGLLNFRVSDPVPFRVSSIVANEPVGGS